MNLQSLIFLVLALCFLVSSQTFPNSCNGESCDHHYQCTGDGEICCNGTCVFRQFLPPTAGEGESCVCATCQDELVCDERNYICVETKHTEIFETCWCEEHNECIFGFCVDNTCQFPPFEEGLECFRDAHCFGNLHCNEGVCSSDGNEEGSVCYEDGALCSDGLYCVFEEENHCVPDVIPEGENCYYDGIYCEQGTYCDDFNSFSFECTAQLEVGAPCSENQMCLTGVCEGTSFCASLKDVDELCNDNIECWSGLCETLGGVEVCVEKLDNGRSCDYNSQCQSNLCDQNNDICIDYYLEGERCYNDECEPGYFCPGFGFSDQCELKRNFTDYCEGSSWCVSGYCQDSRCLERYPSGSIVHYAGECEVLSELTYQSICMPRHPVGYPSDFNGNECIYSRSDYDNGYFCDAANEANCDVDLECPDGFYCSSDCANNKQSYGQFCIQDNECLSEHCFANACTNSSEGNACTFDSDCGGRTGKCIDGACGLVADYEICNTDSDCSDLSYCASYQYVCFDPLPTGSDCSLNYHCESQYCKNFNCTERSDTGEFCDTDNDCLSQNCNLELEKCYPYACGNVKCEINQGCNFDEDCLSNHCSGGTCSVPNRNLGDECDGLSAPCDYGLFCESSDDDKICKRFEIPDSCIYDYQCNGFGINDYICLDGEYKCISRSNLPTSGECEFDRQCQFFCDQVNRVCASSYREDYDACFDSGECNPGSTCKSTGTCYPDFELGDFNELCPCKPDLYCSPNEGKCLECEDFSTTRGDSHLYCDNRFQCSTNFVYDNTCLLVDEVEEGEECFNTVECSGWAVCDGGYCRAIQSLQQGDECTSTNYCELPYTCQYSSNVSAFVCQDTDIARAGDECSSLLDDDDDRGNLLCYCKDEDFVYSDASNIDAIAPFKEYATSCIPTNISWIPIDPFSFVESYRFDVNAAEEEDEDAWETCHKAAMRYLCHGYCGYFLQASNPIYTMFFIREYISLTDDVTIDCATGDVTIGDNCPQIRFQNCNATNPLNELLSQIRGSEFSLDQLIDGGNKPGSDNLNSSNLISFATLLLIGIVIGF